MPGIFKRFTSVSADKYVFPDAEDLSFPAEAEYEPPALEDLGGGDGESPPPDTEEQAREAEQKKPVKKKEPGPIDFAQVQAEAILAEAAEEARKLREKALAQAEEEAEELKRQAHTEGYQAGFAQGMAEGRQEAKVQREQMAAAQMNWSATSGGYIWPETASKRITSPMGGRNTGIKGASTNHKGVDIGGVGYSTNVLATKAGIVITSERSSSYGNYVVISHGSGNTTLYAHMSSRSVKEGDVVSQGQVIGVTGSTGISSGPHLHYEITEGGVRVDPLNYLPGYVKAW